MINSLSSASASSGASYQAQSPPIVDLWPLKIEAIDKDIILNDAQAPRARESDRSASRGRTYCTPAQRQARLATLLT